MDFAHLHDWSVTYTEAVALQRRLADQVRLEDGLPSSLRWVAGVDVSYEKHGDLFFAAVVVLSYPDLQVVEEASAVDRVSFPYIPGLLSFRELPVLLQAFEGLQTRPDVVLVDGQGIAHPRRLGLASHLGLWLKLPTIGCAKSRLCGAHGEPGLQKGEGAVLELNGDPVGVVLRTRERVRPLYVSPGHLCTVARAAQVTLACTTRYRMPEPTRQAHLFTNRLRLQAREGAAKA
ncbi:MAG: deoxyribonuclease V [Desulfuromonadales bacterium]|nr:deoxyribonuclease V [Desulfuromonadales bacterium]MDW7757487.1 deoxyribonuclease V [Desulfuromonadales bacterium]